MKNDINIQLISTLSSAQGAPGDEKQVTDILKKELAPYGKNVKTDRSGNLIVRLSPEAPAKPSKKIMVCAHMDEAGFMIKSVSDDGKFYFMPLGGFSSEYSAGKRVVFGRKNSIGVIGVKPLHLSSADERSKPAPVDRMYIEAGTENKKEAVKLASPGDCGTLYSEPGIFAESFIRGKALASRAPCAALCGLINGINTKTLTDTLYFVFTSKSLIGSLGAKTASDTIKPDIAIIIDGAEAFDMTGVEEKDRNCVVGDGAVLTYAGGGTIFNRALVAQCLSLASGNGIKTQIRRSASGYGDDTAIHKNGTGAETVSLCIPVRQAGSAESIISTADYKAVTGLAGALLDYLNNERI